MITLPVLNTLDLDYNKPITRHHLDLVNYNLKFKLCDVFLNSPNPDMSDYVTLLQDITCFSYLKFRVDGKRVKLFPYQDMILNDSHKFKIFRASRQIGKSLSLDIKSAYNLIKDHGYGHNECIISASLPQASYQMRRVKGLLNSIPGLNWKENRIADNTTLLVLDVLDSQGKSKYQNMLVVTPCTEGSLGYSFHSVNLDEIEYWRDIDIDNFINNIISPTILATDGSITTFSNPNGSENYISYLETLKLPNGQNKYHVYVFDFFDCPLNNQSKFDLMTVGLTRQQIESQYLAIRSLSDRYYFTVDEIDNSFDFKLDREKDWVAVGKDTYWFLDVGSKHDQCCLVGAFVSIESHDKNRDFVHVHVFKFHVYPVGYPLSRVVGSYSEEISTDGWHYEKSVKEYLEEYSLVKGVHPVFGCDVTGNSGIVPLFHSIGISPVDVIFSGPRKWSMYQRLKYYLEKKMLHRVRCKEFEHQSKRIIVTRLRTSTYNRVGHEHEDDLDDTVDSIVGVIQLCDNYTGVTPGFTFLGQSDSIEFEVKDTDEDTDLILRYN